MVNTQKLETCYNQKMWKRSIHKNVKTVKAQKCENSQNKQCEKGQNTKCENGQNAKMWKRSKRKQGKTLVNHNYKNINMDNNKYGFNDKVFRYLGI